MNQLSADQAMSIAASHLAACRFEQAEAIYRGILDRQPDQAEALHALGILAAQTRRLELAEQSISRAVTLKPSLGHAYANLGGVLLQMGKNVQAIAALDRALELQPDNVEILCNRGVALIAAGRLDEAIESFSRAIEIKPNFAEGHNNLGNVYKDKGRLDDAIVEYGAAVRARPLYYDAFVNLGNALTLNNQPEEAVEAYHRAIAIKPAAGSALVNLGILLKELNRLDESLAAFDCALALEPENAQLHNNRAITLEAMGRMDEALTAFARAIQLQPTNVHLFNNVGTVLRNLGQLDAAASLFREMTRLQPDKADPFVSLGGVLTERGNLSDAMHAYKRAIELDPNNSAAHSNIGTTFKEMGRLDEALAAYRRAIEIDPANAVAHSNLVYAVMFHPDCDAKNILAEARNWSAVQERPLAGEIRPHTNNRSPDRRLKIGYVSPDFRGHVVGRNLLPLVMHHNHERFDIHFYNTAYSSDAITGRLRECADHWHDSARLSDADLAHQIRKDGIDILVDLTLHMAGSRLLVFARKPAPVQATYLGYCGTTGMDAMDYRLSDPFMDPPDVDLSCYSEKTIRLPRTYWCYLPNLMNDPSSIPSAENGTITFGCLNNFAKVSAPTIDLWCEIMSRVPTSHVILYAPAGEHRECLKHRFAKQGIAADRIEFIGKQPLDQYARTYERIDIALDPFPYGGGITTCDSLWQGVPVVSLKGGIAVGRGGASVLTNIGLTDCIANSREDYLAIAVRLAQDESRRIQLRNNLRSMMQHSPLMDGKQFAIDVESAYRQMWKSWCATA